MREAQTTRSPDGGTDRPPLVEAATLGAVLAHVARLLGRNLGMLATPVIVVSVALSVAGWAVQLMNLGGQAIIVNGELRLDHPEQGLIVTSVAVLGVFAAAHLVMVATVVVMAAGVLLDHRVHPGPALRLALRRSGHLLELLLIGSTVLVLGGAVCLAFVAKHRWLFAALALVLLVVVACWFLLVVPVVVLEHVGPLRALSRLWEITKFRRAAVIWFTLLVAVVFPVLLGIALRWLVSVPLSDDVMRAGATAVVLTVVSVLLVLVQGATVTVLVLNQHHVDPYSGFWNSPHSRVNLEEVAARLPAAASRSGVRPKRATALAAVALLVTPGVLYGGYLQVNPLNLPSITDQAVKAGDFHNELVLLGGQRTTIITQSDDDDENTGTRDAYKAQVCAGTECDKTSTFTIPAEGRYRLHSVPLPDGSMAVSWGNRARGGNEVVRLMRCTADGCSNTRSADKYPIIASGRINQPNFPRPAWDIAPSGQGIVVAAIVETPEDSRKEKRQNDEDERIDYFTLKIVRCADMRCAEPRSLASIPMETPESGSPPEVAIETGGGNRPVVAVKTSAATRSDRADVAIITCGDAECRKPITRELGPPIWIYQPDSLFGISFRLAVPPDSRPVLAYQDNLNRELRLLRCRTPDCANIDHVTLAGFDAAAQWRPYDVSGSSMDMALGPDGLPWIAAFDTARRAIVVHACKVADCSRRSTATLLTGVLPEGTLQMAMTRDGRPQVLWSYGGEPVNRLLTCREPRCGM